MDAGKSVGVSAAGPDTIAPLANGSRRLLKTSRFGLPRLIGPRVVFPRSATGRNSDGLAEIQFFPTPKRHFGARGQDLAMRAADIVLGAMLLVFLAPLLILLGILVRLDSAGPALFRQTRYGLNGRPFTIYKFRTMTCADNGPTMIQATRNDPRVTRVGRWLRKLSLDELPQILNVLGGDMSLVGPRPHPVAMDWRFAREIPYYGHRFLVKPGITGLAQIRGLRGEITCEAHLRQRVLHDILFVRRRSFAMYLRILALTAAVVLFQREAY